MRRRRSPLRQRRRPSLASFGRSTLSSAGILKRRMRTWRLSGSEEAAPGIDFCGDAKIGTGAAGSAPGGSCAKKKGDVKTKYTNARKGRIRNERSPVEKLNTRKRLWDKFEKASREFGGKEAAFSIMKRDNDYGREKCEGERWRRDYCLRQRGNGARTRCGGRRLAV